MKCLKHYFNSHLQLRQVSFGLVTVAVWTFDGFLGCQWNKMLRITQRIKSKPENRRLLQGGLLSCLIGKGQPCDLTRRAISGFWFDLIKARFFFPVTCPTTGSTSSTTRPSRDLKSWRICKHSHLLKSSPVKTHIQQGIKPLYREDPKVASHPLLRRRQFNQLFKTIQRVAILNSHFGTKGNTMIIHLILERTPIGWFWKRVNLIRTTPKSLTSNVARDFCPPL